MQSLFWIAVSKGLVSPIPHGDSLVYAISGLIFFSLILFHVSIFAVAVLYGFGALDPDCVPSSYFHFVNGASGGLMLNNLRPAC